MVSYFDGLLERTIDCLRRATVDRDVVLGRAVPRGPHSDPKSIDRAWNDLRAAQPELRVLEDGVIGALRELYEVHEDFDQVTKVIRKAEAGWVYDVIFNRAVETVSEHADSE